MPKDEFLYLFCSKADKELILRSALERSDR